MLSYCCVIPKLLAYASTVVARRSSPYLTTARDIPRIPEVKLFVTFSTSTLNRDARSTDKAVREVANCCAALSGASTA